MIVQVGKDWVKGMGTQLGALSVFLHSGVKKLEVGDMRIYNAFMEYINIFNIDNLTIEFYPFTMSNPVHPGDAFKAFSPYYKKPRTKKRRPYIGIACYDDSGRVFNLNDLDLTYPKNKLYPVENYTEIFKIIKNAGYDVVTFDSKEISKTEKARIIEDLCECVIGYEGGIAHLCHMLDVPYIMLPWRNHQGLEQIMHLDNKTYFLNSVHELLNWVNDNQSMLLETLDKLNNGLGNNKFLNGTSNIQIDNDFKLVENRNVLPIVFNDTEKKFFKDHMQLLKVGGNE